MKYINKRNLIENKVDTISLFTSAFTDKLDTMGVDPKDAIVKICAECPKNDEAEAIVKATLANFCAEGYMLNGNIYDAFCAGASDARKATATWLRHDLVPELGRWAMCGLNTKNMKLAINKYMAYIGLLFSASKPFVDVFDKKVDIRRVAIIKDTDVTVNAIADLVTMESVSHKVNREMVINAFRGRW